MNQDLGQCWNSWIAKARELKSENITCCAPLFSSKPLEFDQRSGRILLFGKATAGWYWKYDKDLNSDLTDAELARNQVETNLEFREGRVDEGAANLGFWNYASRLGSAFGDKSPSRQNLIWSNLFKIGSERGNPNRPSVKRQWELAIETARLEIQTYSPSLVVFATLGFHDSLVYEIAGLDHKHDWIGESERTPDEMWSLRAADMPPMLWTRHPAFKSRKTIEGWIERAVSL